MEISCPVCTESFRPSSAFEHLATFHAAPSIWQCGDCVVRGSFNHLALHCFRVGHPSQRIQLLSPQQLQLFPAWLQTIQEAMGMDPINQALLLPEGWDPPLMVAKPKDGTSPLSGNISELSNSATEGNEEPSSWTKGTTSSSSQTNPQEVEPTSDDSLSNAKPVRPYECSSESAETNFKCLQCDKKFYRQKLLNRHQNSVHKGLRPFKCTFCKYSAAQSNNLKRHNEAVHEKRRPFKCNSCEYSAAAANELNRHCRAVHLGRKPFECSACQYSTAQSTHLKRHYEAVHGKRKLFA